MAYIPNQGDIIKMDFNPTKGHEQRGSHRRGVAMVCPITNSDRNIKIHIRLDNRTTTTGVIMTDQVKALDLTVRNAEFIEKIPSDILVEVCDIISGFSEIED